MHDMTPPPRTRAKPPAAPEAEARKEGPLLIDLALQGGGSHGAFTWGVLDRLLQESRFQIEAISGTSAGAMNAAVLADGFTAGGAEGARTALENFWRKVSKAAEMSPLKRGPLDVLLGTWSLDNSPAYVAMDIMTRLFSPYDMPSSRRRIRYGADPARRAVDFEAAGAGADQAVSSRRPMCRTGRGRVFRNKATVTPDVIAGLGLPAARCSRLSRSTARLIGMAASPATRRMTPLVQELTSDDTILVRHQSGGAPRHAAQRARHTSTA
jgi:NTE family protein